MLELRHLDVEGQFRHVADADEAARLAGDGVAFCHEQTALTRVVVVLCHVAHSFRID